jgi:hypothetical protein
MRYLCLFVFVLFLGAGCSEAHQEQWNEAMKDWRGDNMQMRYGAQGATQTKAAAN